MRPDLLSQRIAFTTPDDSFDEVAEVIRGVTREFPSNPLCRRLEEGTFTMKDYHSILRALFHQVYASSGSFSLAAANCPPHHTDIRDYLIKHSEEEKTHWTWILNDLKKTGYKGTDPRTEFPSTSTQAYIAFNHYVSTYHPIARLGIALMLESVGAAFGKRYGEKLVKTLSLTPAQVVFFFGHGDTDVGHTEEIWQMIKNATLTPPEIGWICHAIRVASKLYQQIYEEAAR